MNSRNPLKYILFVLLISLPIFVKAALTEGDNSSSVGLLNTSSSKSITHIQDAGSDRFMSFSYT